MAARPAELVHGIVRVGTVQSVYDRLTEVMNHPLTSAGDIGKVIAEDPDLTARLLRLVNSPIYGFPSRISTVSQAISIVGLNQLHELAVGASFIRLFGDLPEGLVDVNSFWRHSVACAVGARALAAHRREPNAERFFVAGLLHDIGRPVLYQKLPAQSREALLRCRATGELLHRVESEMYGFHHGQVGAALLERWKLPALIQEVVAWHHNPRMATRYPVETAAVHVADHIANAFQLGTSGEHLVPPLVPEAWERLELSPETLPAVLQQIEEVYQETLAAILGDGR